MYPLCPLLSSSSFFFPLLPLPSYFLSLYSFFCFFDLEAKEGAETEGNKAEEGRKEEKKGKKAEKGRKERKRKKEKERGRKEKRKKGRKERKGKKEKERESKRKKEKERKQGKKTLKTVLFFFDKTQPNHPKRRTTRGRSRTTRGRSRTMRVDHSKPHLETAFRTINSRKQNQVDQEPREGRSIQKHEVDQEPCEGRSRITTSFAMCLKPLFPENQEDQEPRR